MDAGYNLSDLAAVMHNNDDDFGAWWTIVLFLFMFGANGWGGRNMPANADGLVTEAGLCNAMNFNNLENAVGRLNDQNQNQTAMLGNGICNLGYAMQGNIGQLGKEVALGQANLQQQLASCCCQTQRAIDSVNYNGAINTAEINKTTTEQTQKILDALTTNRMAEMQNQINQLQLQSAMCGVVRYPNATTFTAGVNPYFNTNCGCGVNF